MADSNAVVARVIGIDGSAEGTVELAPEIFSIDRNIGLLHQVVVAEEAGLRRGTHSTKTRAEVSGGGAKPFRQKGTGNARQGSTRAPQFTGGGVVHGPKPRSYAQATPKKMIRAALAQALSDRASEGRIVIVKGAPTSPSTKVAVAWMRSADMEGSQIALVAEAGEELLVRSFRNLPKLLIATPDSLLTRTVLVADHVVFSEAGLSRLEARLSGEVRR